MRICEKNMQIGKKTNATLQFGFEISKQSAKQLCSLL